MLNQNWNEYLVFSTIWTGFWPNNTFRGVKWSNKSSSCVSVQLDVQQRQHKSITVTFSSLTIRAFTSLRHDLHESNIWISSVCSCEVIRTKPPDLELHSSCLNLGQSTGPSLLLPSLFYDYFKQRVEKRVEGSCGGGMETLIASSVICWWTQYCLPPGCTSPV